MISDRQIPEEIAVGSFQDEEANDSDKPYRKRQTLCISSYQGNSSFTDVISDVILFFFSLGFALYCLLYQPVLYVFVSSGILTAYFDSCQMQSVLVSLEYLELAGGRRPW